MTHLLLFTLRDEARELWEAINPRMTFLLQGSEFYLRVIRILNVEEESSTIYYNLVRGRKLNNFAGLLTLL